MIATDRPSHSRLDQMTDDDLEALYTRLDAAEARVAELEAARDRVRALADRLADGTEAGFRTALAIRDALDGPARPGLGAIVRRTVDYVLQSQQPDGTWEMSGGPHEDRTYAEQRLQRHRERMPDVTHRLAERTTTVAVRPLPDPQS